MVSIHRRLEILSGSGFKIPAGILLQVNFCNSAPVVGFVYFGVQGQAGVYVADAGVKILPFAKGNTAFKIKLSFIAIQRYRKIVFVYSFIQTVKVVITIAKYKMRF